MPPLQDFARLYTAAWCSQNPASVAAFYEFDGSLQVNQGPPAVGRPAITATAASFMTDFPDLHVSMSSLIEGQGTATYQWTLEGTHAVSHRPVKISGFEHWTLGPEGLIAESKGSFDAADYQRQITC